MGELLSEAGEAPEGLLLHLYNGQSPLQAARHNKAHLDKVDAASEQQIAAFQKCIDVLSEALRTVATSAVKDANKDELAKVFAAGGSLFDVNGTLPSGPAKKKKKNIIFFILFVTQRQAHDLLARRYRQCGPHPHGPRPRRSRI